MLLIPGVLTFLMLMVLVYDVSRYVIPNWLVLLILALWPAMILWSAAETVDWITAILAGGAAFAIGFAMFAAKMIGGGDVKLLAVCCVWTELDALAPYLMAVAVIGGIMSLLLLFLRPTIAFMIAREKEPPALPRVFLQGEPVPYGVAIALGFLIVLWLGKIPGVEVLL